MLACSAGVLLMQANAINSQSFIRPAMFDLQLSGRWGGERKNVICAPLPLPLSLFLTVDRPLGTNFFFSPQPFAAIQNQRWHQSTRSPKLRLLCRLI